VDWIGGAATRGEGKGVHPDQSLVIAAVEVRTRPAKKGDKPMRRGGRYAGRLRMEVVPDRTAKSLVDFVEAAVAPSAMIVTDAAPSYATLSKRGFEHLPVVEAGNPEVAEEYLPIIHLIFSNLKSWLAGCHHGVSPQHLQAYLNEFTFRFNRRFYPFNAFRSLLGIGMGNESPTYDELYSGEWEHPRVSDQAFYVLPHHHGGPNCIAGDRDWIGVVRRDRAITKNSRRLDPCLGSASNSGGKTLDAAAGRCGPVQLPARPA
jgi:transposase-like protein